MPPDFILKGCNRALPNAEGLRKDHQVGGSRQSAAASPSPQLFVSLCPSWPGFQGCPSSKVTNKTAVSAQQMPEGESRSRRPARAPLRPRHLTWWVIERHRQKPDRPEHMASRTPALPCAAPAGPPGKGEGEGGGWLCCPRASGKQPTHLHAHRGHVPGRHVTAFKISESGESCALDNRAGSRLGPTLSPSGGRRAHVLTHAPAGTAPHKVCASG